jgi:hypothetical protein
MSPGGRLLRNRGGGDCVAVEWVAARFASAYLVDENVQCPCTFHLQIQFPIPNSQLFLYLTLTRPWEYVIWLCAVCRINTLAA